MSPNSLLKKKLKQFQKVVLSESIKAIVTGKKSHHPHGFDSWGSLQQGF